MEGPVQDSPAGKVDTSENQAPSANQESAENSTNGNIVPEKSESGGGDAAEDAEAQPKDTEVKVDETVKEETRENPSEQVKTETKEDAVEKPEGESKQESTDKSKQESKQDANQESKEGDNAESGEDDEIERLKKKPVDQLTPLERAQIAASKAVISTLPELDPIELPPAGTGLPKHQHRYTLSAIRAIKRLKDALPFVVPVDPVKQGVPQYFDYIKHPMDLGTMEKKLVEQKYDTIKDFIDDFNLIISNCMIFNGEDAPISHMALGIAQSFKKQLSNMPTYDASKKGAQALAAATAATGGAGAATSADVSAIEAGSPGINTAGALAGAAGLSGSAVEDGHHEDGVGKRQTTTTTVVGPNGMPTLRRKSTIDGRPKREIRPPRQPGTFFGSGSGQGRPRNKKYASELRFAGQVLKEMQGRKLENIAWPFLVPVDPIEQGVPTYFDVIKEPMDLSTIQRKLVDGIYYTGDEFESDVRLMFRNCYTFNPEGTPVNVLGHKLEDYFDSRWIDKPVPGMHNVDDSDMSDVDEEYAETGMVSPAIEVLEEQKRMINKQLKRLKKEALADFHKRGHKGGRSSAPKRRRSSNAASGGSSGHHHSTSGSTSSARALPTEMTYEMKRQIHDQMENLSQQQIATVIAIIQESMPEMRGQDEIELEVDALDTQTQLRIYNYAVLNRADKPLGTSRAGSNDDDADHYTRKKKSKALSEEEHAMKVAEINRKLRDIEEAKNGGASLGGNAAAVPTTDVAAGSASASGAAADSDSSDEDLDSDSSSEEE